MKESYPDLSVKDIQDWVGPAYYRKGESYFHQGAINEARRQGMTLKVAVLAHRRSHIGCKPPWMRTVLLMQSAHAQLRNAGHCKHVAALLLLGWTIQRAFDEIADHKPLGNIAASQS